MENINIYGKKDQFFTPDINFNKELGKCFIGGESYLENAFDFYDKLINWIKEYFDEGNEGLTLDIKLTYFNTSSSRALLDLFRLLKTYAKSSKNVTVNWFYPEPDDDDMKLEAEDFMDESGLIMNLISYPEEAFV